MERKVLGDIGEEMGALLLEAEGYEILERKYRCRLGEADLICAKGGSIYFVEVKTRSGYSMGLPVEAVDRRKRERIRRVAQFYLQSRKIRSANVRFRVIEIVVRQTDDDFM